MVCLLRLMAFPLIAHMLDRQFSDLDSSGQKLQKREGAEQGLDHLQILMETYRGDVSKLGIPKKYWMYQISGRPS